MDYSVNRIVPSTIEKKIEKRILKEEAGSAADQLGGANEKSEAKARRERIVRRAAKELKDGVSNFTKLLK